MGGIGDGVVVSDRAEANINRFGEVCSGLDDRQKLPAIRASGIRSPARREISGVGGFEVGHDLVTLSLNSEPNIRIGTVIIGGSIPTILLQSARQVIGIGRQVEAADAFNLAVSIGGIGWRGANLHIVSSGCQR